MDTKYLQQRGHQWWVRVTVPRTLVHLLGTHLRESLRTSDLKVANRRKFEVLAILKDRIVKARNESPTATKSKAATFREALREAYTEGRHTSVEVVESLAVDEAERIEQEQGVDVAQAFYAEATSLAPTLAEAAEDWFNATVTKESTRLKRRKAYQRKLPRQVDSSEAEFFPASNRSRNTAGGRFPSASWGRSSL